MKLTKREARKRFDSGETVYGYKKWMTEGHDKPLPLFKYDEDVTFDSEYAIAVMCGDDGFLSDVPYMNL